MNTYKYSKYNVLIDTDNENVILFNSFSGGIIKLELKLYDNLVNNHFSNLKSQEIETLVQGGYIVQSDFDESHRVERLFQNECLNPKPELVTYVIAPTLRCNLNCIYCFQKNYRSNDSQRVSDKTLDNIINFILKINKNNSNLKYIKINWFGGEPLLCYDAIVRLSCKIQKKLEPRGIKLLTGIITNGVLLDANKLSILKDKCCLRHLQITIDGELETYCAKKQTTADVFKKVIDNIRLATHYVETVVRLNADKTNYEEILRLVDFIYSMDINETNLKMHFAQLRNYTNDFGVENLYFDDFEYELKRKDFLRRQHHREHFLSKKKSGVPRFTGKLNCGLLPQFNFVIDGDGNLYKCEHHLGDDSKIVGDVIRGTINYPNYTQCINSINNDSRCKSCNLFPICNYVQCTVMHEFCGEGKCKMYDVQLKVVKSRIKNYMREYTEDVETKEIKNQYGS